MQPAVYVISITEDKGVELGFVADILRCREFCVPMVDVGINAPPFAATLLQHFQELLP